MECVRKTLFLEDNLNNADVYFCIFCNQFNTKSKFKPDIEEESEHDENDKSNLYRLKLKLSKMISCFKIQVNLRISRVPDVINI